jgi:hypothetical protein
MGDAMGLLDDLKKQAEMLKTQQNVQQTVNVDKIKLVEDKMRQTFQYVNELLKQLAVLKPTSPLTFQIEGVAAWKNLVFTESFIDYRRKRIGDKEHFDTVNFYIKWASSDVLVIERDMPPAAQKVRESLYASKVKFTEEEKKNPKGFVVGAKFTIPVAVITDVLIKADHDGGRLMVQAKNLTSLGGEHFVVPAPEINDELLEEFARTLIGQPSKFSRFRAAPPIAGPVTRT